jgi:hypothetical protein
LCGFLSKNLINFKIKVSTFASDFVGHCRGRRRSVGREELEGRVGKDSRFGSQTLETADGVERSGEEDF